MFIISKCEFILKEENVKELQKTIKSLFRRTTDSVFNVSRGIHSKVFNSVITRTFAVFLLLFLINVLCVTKTYGEMEIKGAFGITLGEIFNPDTATVTGTLADGTPMYKIDPNKRYKAFDRYFVTITPKSHKVYSIWGIGECRDSMVCAKQQDIILDMLKRKYGAYRKKDSDDTFTSIKEIDQGCKYVIVKCSGFPETSIEIQYHDRDLESIAIEELMEKTDDINGSIF